MSGLVSTPASGIKAGDTIQVWWGSKRATISGFRSHDSGREGWKIADFTDGYSMTITHTSVERLAR